MLKRRHYSKNSFETFKESKFLSHKKKGFKKREFAKVGNQNSQKKTAQLWE